jgi:hypothetical protein
MLSLSASGARAEVSPLPASDYSVRSACSTPVAGRAGCLALQLVPVTSAARSYTHPLVLSATHPLRPASAVTEGAYGLRPQDLHRAYDLPLNAPVAQTIAIVDAYDDPNAEGDLAVYDHEFGLPECTAANGCFTKINANGQTSPLPAASGEWSMEVALDVESAHAICQNCRILLVEAQSNTNGALEAAENRAVLAGATEVSNSWGTLEPIADSAAFNHPGVVITAAAGDSGYRGWNAWSASERGAVLYPASSPHVVAVGATRLALNAGGEWAGESVWNNSDGASGGGCSTHFTAPHWQQVLPNWSAVGCGTSRAAADVAAVGDPYTGAAIYDSTPWDGYVLGWVPIGGTSLASPLIAAAYALAGGAHGQPYPAEALYESERGAPGSLHNITASSNGECWAASSGSGESGCSASQEAASCGARAICLAGAGYSGAAGVGTPNGLNAFLPGSFPLGSDTNEAGAVGGENGTDAGGGSGAAAASEAGSQQPPASGHTPSSHTAHPHHGIGHSRVVTLSGLTLTANAVAALHRPRTSVAKLAFRFSLSKTVPVRVTLHKLTSASAQQASAGAGRADVLASSFQLVAHKGRNQWHLRGAGTLGQGQYRLTLAPDAGAARSLVVAVN